MSGSLAVAIVALAVSVASLTWQFALYLLGGARLKTELKIGAKNMDRAVTAPTTAVSTLQSLTEQGFTDKLLVAEVRNVGRLATSVTACSIYVDNGSVFTNPGWHINPSLPARLEPGEELNFYFDLSTMKAAVVAFRGTNMPARTISAQASAGTGKIAKSRNHLSVELLERM